MEIKPISRIARPKKTLVSAKILAETKERLSRIIAASSHVNTPTIYELLDEGSIAIAKKRGLTDLVTKGI